MLRRSVICRHREEPPSTRIGRLTHCTISTPITTLHLPCHSHLAMCLIAAGQNGTKLGHQPPQHTPALLAEFFLHERYPRHADKTRLCERTVPCVIFLRARERERVNAWLNVRGRTGLLVQAAGNVVHRQTQKMPHVRACMPATPRRDYDA